MLIIFEVFSFFKIDSNPSNFSKTKFSSFTGLSNAKESKESEELERKVEELLIIPDEKVLIYSVNDSIMITCNGTDVKWRSVNGTYVDSYDKMSRIHVEDFSTSSSEYQQLGLVFKEVSEMDHGEWTCVGLYEEKSFTLFVYGKFAN